MKFAKVQGSALVVALASTTLLVAACTVDSNDSSGGQTATSGGQTAPKKTANGDAAQSVVDSIKPDTSLAKKLPAKYRDSINVGMTFTFPPMRYMEDNKRQGAEYDLARAVAKTLGTDIEIKVVSFDGLVPALKAKRIDVAVESFADFPERRKEVSFVDYYRSATTLEVPKGNPNGIEGLDDLCGHSLAVQQGVGSVKRAQKQNKQCKAEGKKPIDIKLFESSNDATLSVVSGRADATANDYPAALNEALTIKGGQALELVDKPISGDYLYGFATRKNEKQLQVTLRDAIQKLMDSGDYKKIFEAYNVTKGLIKQSGINIGPAKD